MDKLCVKWLFFVIVINFSLVFSTNVPEMVNTSIRRIFLSCYIKAQANIEKKTLLIDVFLLIKREDNCFHWNMHRILMKHNYITLIHKRCHFSCKSGYQKSVRPKFYHIKTIKYQLTYCRMCLELVWFHYDDSFFL